METHFHSLTYVQAPITAAMETHCELRVASVLTNHGTASRQKWKIKRAVFQHITYIQDILHS